uniref:Eukaryotic translation initiation factor 4E family member 2 n=1 Tax=Oncorhynchus mykiss TaxID=8022 RepID=A0A8K9UYL0_ONCMY
MNNKFDALKDDDSGDHDQDQGSQKDCEKEKNDNDEDNDQNTAKKKIAVPGVGEHPLQYNYSFWYSRRTPGRPASTQSYESNIKQIGSFASVEQFWRFYSHMIRPGDLTGHSDFHLFKEGIKPMWEDDANKLGGKWIIRLRKGLASRCWENLILAMLGEQFMVGGEICGAVVSVRFQVHTYIEPDVQTHRHAHTHSPFQCLLLPTPCFPHVFPPGGHHLHLEQDSQ